MNMSIVIIDASNDETFDAICTIPTSITSTASITEEVLNDLLNASPEFKECMSDYYAMLVDDAEVTGFHSIGDGEFTITTENDAPLEGLVEIHVHLCRRIG